MDYFSQHGYSLRFEWGLSGIDYLAAAAECVVIVDVMSFSTCVSVATGRGATVYPYRWRDDTAFEYGKQLRAVVADPHRRLSDGYSLSPSSLLTIPAGTRLVLPSPNGSSAAWLARDSGATVLSGCLRNRQATAEACRGFASVLVVACGERWPDGSLRPSLEDQLAAGGIIAALPQLRPSPEAQAAALLYRGFGPTRQQALAQCSSAIELRERGFGADVALCIEEDVSSNACWLDGDRFVARSG
ncbi:2-phosphosulfolactate phosphatase [Chitinimonas lacunae]|uniref:Probable 2-phosphosulfolactate phosphatase n=1 Tax=Chitinimonas lacunae TaxID=1963018 RepID=A0ABV8MNS1_9NEIS